MYWAIQPFFLHTLSVDIIAVEIKINVNGSTYPSSNLWRSVISEVEIYEGEICEDRYDKGFEAGKQYCINNPEACGCIGGYTQSDLDNARQEGYNSGCNDCSNGSSSPATISPELNLHIPVLQYQSPFGAMDLWADFEFAGESDGDMLWKLSDFGQK